MKIHILIGEGTKQIMMTPETDHEKTCLKMIGPGDSLHTVEILSGNFYSSSNSPANVGLNIYECQGGYQRAEERPESLMFVVREKAKNKNSNS